MKTNILYFHVGLTTFVVKDIGLLSRHFTLHPFSFDSESVLLSLFKQFTFLLRHLFSSKMYVVQFAGYHSFLPVIFARVFGKKAVLILGGTDCVSFPSIRYGNFNNKKMAFFTGSSIKHAHLLLPVDISLVKYNYTYTNNDFPYQGYLAHVPSAEKVPYQVIYNGYDGSKWKPATKTKKTFVTAGANLNSRFGIALKGIDLILTVATNFPDCTFYIVGGKGFTGIIPPNVEMLGTIPNDQLPEFLSDKQFYMQLSISEGFPNALSEAMLCGCVPIVSNVASLSALINDAGFVLKNRNPELLRQLIQSAIESNDLAYRSQKARSIIDSNYTELRRENELVNALLTIL